MFKLMIFLSLFLFVASCNVTSEPSEEQLSFSNKLLETPGVLNTVWNNRLSLKVTVDLDSLGSPPKMKAQLLADEIAAAGHAYTGKSICVTIYYGYKNKLADSCIYNDNL